MLSTLLLASLLHSPAFACEGDKSSTAQGEKKAGTSCHMPQQSAVAELPADGTHSRLAVSGMHCGACADKVHAALMGVEGVKGAKVDLAGNTVEVAYDATKVNLDKLIAAVNATGTCTATVAKN